MTSNDRHDTVRLTTAANPFEAHIAETRNEKRHTDSAQYRDRVASEESRLRALLEKVRRLAQ
jgi:hypothetical protein